MHTLSLDGERESFLSQLPLHEGRRYRVDRSGGIDLLSGAEFDAVGRLIACHRISPGDCSLVIPKQESQVLFQIFENNPYSSFRQFHPLGDKLR